MRSHIHTHWRHLSQHLLILFFRRRYQSSSSSKHAQATCPPCHPLVTPQHIRVALAPLRVSRGQAEWRFGGHADTQTAFQSVAFVWSLSTWLGRLQEEGIDETRRSWPGCPGHRHGGRAVGGARGGLRTPELWEEQKYQIVYNGDMDKCLLCENQHITFYSLLFKSILFCSIRSAPPFYSNTFYTIMFYSILSYCIQFCSILVLFCSILFYSVVFLFQFTSFILFHSILFSYVPF